MKRLLSKAIAEIVGTSAIVLFGCGSVAIAAHSLNSDLMGMVPLIFGLTVCMMVYAIGHLSGAHFNPAVTLAFACISRFPWRQVPTYWTAQFIGGIIGCALIALFIPETATYAATIPAVPTLNAILVEIVITFFLMFVVTSVATDSRAIGMMAGLAVGITVAVCAFFGGPLTGASMNPARSLGPAIFEGQLGVFWIYLVGPFLGAVLGALTYKAIRCEPTPAIKSQVKGCC